MKAIFTVTFTNKTFIKVDSETAVMLANALEYQEAHNTNYQQVWGTEQDFELTVKLSEIISIQKD